MLKQFNKEGDTMTHLEINKRFMYMWRKSLADSKHTQSYIAKAMNVSRQTVAHWLNGDSCPDQRQGFEWFLKLGLQPLPYYLELFYPEFENITKAEDEQIKKALHALINGIPPKERRKLLYCFHGSHGSSPQAVLELLTAYLHTPLKDRISIANAIVINYTLAEKAQKLVKPLYTKPNIELLRLAIKRCTFSLLGGHTNYTAILEDVDTPLE